MEKKEIVINEKWCKGCGICATFCPKGVLAVDAKVKVVNKDDCIFCGQCEQRCPDYAISIEAVKDEK